MKSALLTSLLAVCCGFTALAGPNIQITPATLNNFYYLSGAGPATAQKVVLESKIMATTTGTVTVTGTTNYEVSLNNTTFSSTVSIPYTGDTLAPTNLFVRLKSGLANGSYVNESIAITATGISTAVSASGLVTAACTVTTGATTSSSAAFTWNATGAASYEIVVDQVAAAPGGAGTATVNGPSYTHTGLSPNTSYYFHVRGISTSARAYSAWTTKAFSTKSTGVASLPSALLSLSISPNPSGGTIVLKGQNGAAAGAIRISVVNAAGQLVYT